MGNFGNISEAVALSGAVIKRTQLQTPNHVIITHLTLSEFHAV